MALQLLYRKLISCDRKMFCKGIYGCFFGYSFVCSPDRAPIGLPAYRCNRGGRNKVEKTVREV